MYVPMVFRLFVQEMLLAFSRALLSAGSSMAAKIAMMAMTTSNSINVKQVFRDGLISSLTPYLFLTCKYHAYYTKLLPRNHIRILF